MPYNTLFINTLDGSRSGAGAEKVVGLFRNEFTRRGLPNSLLHIDFPGERSLNTDFAIISSNVYFPYPERGHLPVTKLAFHALENYNPLALYRVEMSGALKGKGLLFSHNLRGFSAGVWSLGNHTDRPIRVHYLHDYQLICTASTMTRGISPCVTRCKRCRILTEMRKQLSSNVDVVIGASSYILDRHLTEGFFKRAVPRVIEPPLDLSGIVLSPYTSTPIRRFGFIGRIVEEKGILRLLNAFSLFLDALPEHERQHVHLVIAGFGEGVFYEEFLRRASVTPNTTFIGSTSPDNFFSQVDILVVPSIWPDPNPLVVVEAYQFGKPVIGAFVGGIQTSVIDGKTGLHFRHDLNDRDMVRALHQAWTGISISEQFMYQQVNGRDIRSAVDQVISDVDQCARDR